MFQCMYWTLGIRIHTPMHEIPICAVADIFQLNYTRSLFHALGPYPLSDIFRSRAHSVHEEQSETYNWKLWDNNSLLQYLQVWLHCPGSGTWKLQNGIKRLDCATASSTMAGWCLLPHQDFHYGRAVVWCLLPHQDLRTAKARVQV
jgi:hypothetical protein